MTRHWLRMLFICLAAGLLVVSCPTRVHAGQPQQLQSQISVPSGSQKRAPCPPAQLQNLPQLTLPEIPRQILRDQKFFWLRPFRMKVRDLPWVGLMVGATAGLVAIDRRVGQGLTDSPPGLGYKFGHNVSRIGAPWTDLGTAGAIYAIGRLRHKQHAQTTGLLGLEAVGDSIVMVEILKYATERPRPTFSGGKVRDHNADGQFFAGGTSFPSGHAAAVFALATVLSERNSDKRWVTPLAFGCASLVGVSRISMRMHFPSDVFVGAALGYMIGRHVAHSKWNSRQDKPPHSKLLSAVSAAGGRILAPSAEF